MDSKDLLPYILDAIPYPIVFVDTTHTILYLNRRAKFHYYQERGYQDLIGKSIFDCHSEISKKKLDETLTRFKNHGQEQFLTVSPRNERVYISPVRDEKGRFLGYFERFEANFTKA